MDEFKSIFASRTVWSCFGVLAAMALGHFGYSFTDADQAAVIDAMMKGVEVVAAVAAIVFRVKATKAIG